MVWVFKKGLKFSSCWSKIRRCGVFWEGFLDSLVDVSVFLWVEEVLGRLDFIELLNIKVKEDVGV